MQGQTGRFASLRNMPNLRVESSSIEPTQPRHARVEGNDEICEIVDPDKRIGTISCLGLLFPTGEVRYFAVDRVTVLPEADDDN